MILCQWQNFHTYCDHKSQRDTNWFNRVHFLVYYNISYVHAFKVLQNHLNIYFKIFCQWIFFLVLIKNCDNVNSKKGEENSFLKFQKKWDAVEGGLVRMKTTIRKLISDEILGILNQSSTQNYQLILAFQLRYL